MVRATKRNGGPLFHRILQSKIRDWYRRTKVRSRWRLWLGRDEAGDPLDAIADTTTPTADDQLKIKEASSALDAALRTLPLRQQQAFLLRAWEELDVAQAAAAMGLLCCRISSRTATGLSVRTAERFLMRA